MIREEQGAAGSVDAGAEASTPDVLDKNHDSAADGEATLDPRIDQLIGRALEAHYEDLAAAPLPDAILVLLAELEAKERSK